MPYVELQIDFTRHDKVQAIPEAHRARAVALFVGVVCHCAEMLTDGHVSRPVLNEIAELTGIKRAGKIAVLLTEVGLFETTSRGFLVHDYLDYQPSRAHVLETRKREAERKREARRRNVPPDVPTNVHPGHPVGQNADVRRDSRARGSAPAPTTEVDLEGDLEAAATEEAARATDAAALIERLEDLGLNGRWLTAARDDQPRAQAWLTKALTEATSNPAGYWRTGFETGDWPAPTATATLEPTREQTHPHLCTHCAGGMRFKTQQKLDEHLRNVHELDTAEPDFEGEEPDGPA